MKSAVTLILALLSVPARAEEVTLKDIQVIGRTLGFMEDATAGTLELGIVYVRGEAEFPASGHSDSGDASERLAPANSCFTPVWFPLTNSQRPELSARFHRSRRGRAGARPPPRCGAAACAGPVYGCGLRAGGHCVLHSVRCRGRNHFQPQRRRGDRGPLYPGLPHARQKVLRRT